MSQTISQPDQTKITLSKTADYREAYANSVQIRLSVWDFLLIFGTMEQDVPDQVNIKNFQGVYLSPQQAKALHNILSHNLAQYEQTFGPISLDVPQNGGPRIVPGKGPIH